MSEVDQRILTKLSRLDPDAQEKFFERLKEMQADPKHFKEVEFAERVTSLNDRQFSWFMQQPR